MSDQTQPLAPCPKCPMCGNEMATRHRYPDDLDAKWYCVDGTGCVLAYRDITRETLNSRPDILSIKELEEKYYELIFAVARKFEGETRHQTALRYIVETENRAFGVGAEIPVCNTPAGESKNAT